EKDWKLRRSQKLDKIELLNLQSSLQSEIQAKQSVMEELKNIKASHVGTESRLAESESRNKELLEEVEKLKETIKELNLKVDDAGSPNRPDSQMSFLNFLKESSKTECLEEVGGFFQSTFDFE
ncbi:serine/threonine-protein kinase MRCK alpha-like, partial [Saccoglossus kowalevskii]|uniref:Serine/threonine-protein kinase MRCK alpha-like n=1 Tax=Saccoglossus kowalevskii TaxID=10224 RepID=A0ABM0M0D7_SACKO